MSLEEQVVQELKKKEFSITTAESCTGGMVASTLINVPGISDLYREGYIVYSNEAKARVLQVEENVLEKYGAVSSQVASQMAEGAAETADVDVAIATTGIAGPDGGTAEEPVGLVYIGCYVDGARYVCENHFEGSRQEIRMQTTKRALEFILECLKKSR